MTKPAHILSADIEFDSTISRAHTARLSAFTVSPPVASPPASPPNAVTAGAAAPPRGLVCG
ncbi:hypothetical protein PAMC26510_11650 [Caballeronia sordidicola]|uniref:Uncharacterized protein n=1 Tax=Caballeronia sordidicola TaxID=196367 RepID=A0A242MZJ2_CABSO|nr:hypothetical protein PAMC26510_11650 [Caballeronia sordidicola]